MRFALLLFAALQLPQLPPRDTGPAPDGPMTASISGVVTAADGGARLRGAEVRLTGTAISGNQNGRTRGVATDAEGRYTFDGLAPGPYTVTVSKPGYVTLAYGQTRPVEQGRSIEVAAGASVRDIDVALPRGAVIVARVADVFGEPAAGYRVVAYQPRFVNGERRLTAVTTDIMHVTDDRGEIRLSNLAPGEYFVGALPGGVAGSTLMNPRGKDPQTFYPGTLAEADAQPVALGLGEEVAVTMQLLSGSRLARISGVIAGTERPALRMFRRVLGSNTGLPVNSTSDGTFNASGLAPGEYTITAQGPTTAGTLRVQVGSEDIDNLVLTLRQALTLRGQFSFDGGKPPSGRWGDFRVSLPDETGFGRVSTIRNDWSFEVPGVFGRGVIRLQPSPPDWFLKAVLVDGKDIVDTPTDYASIGDRPIEVVITQRFAEVTGTVESGTGTSGFSRTTAESDYLVVAFPDDPTQWTPHSRFILTARPDQNGRFTLRGLGAGGYFIRAVPYLTPGQERDPATLARLRNGATALAVAEGQSQSLRLTIAP